MPPITRSRYGPPGDSVIFRTQGGDNAILSTDTRRGQGQLKNRGREMIDQARYGSPGDRGSPHTRTGDRIMIA